MGKTSAEMDKELFLAISSVAFEAEYERLEAEAAREHANQLPNPFSIGVRSAAKGFSQSMQQGRRLPMQPMQNTGADNQLSM